jgi:2-oxoglutarate dehydrogenase E2 component (dihydrolipoamide succinyltransferase)
MSDSVEVRAPAEQTEGTRSQILRWLKQVGEAVAENEPLIEIETDKVTVEVAAPGTGVLREILKQEQVRLSRRPAGAHRGGRRPRAARAAAPLGATGPRGPGRGSGAARGWRPGVPPCGAARRART